MMLPTQDENPHGLHQRYVVAKADGTPVDPLAIYFVLRIDAHGDDPAHIEACRAAAIAYADVVQSGDPKFAHLSQLGAELRQKSGG